jgi:hypothetical protein
MLPEVAATRGCWSSASQAWPFPPPCSASTATHRFDSPQIPGIGFLQLGQVPDDLRDAGLQPNSGSGSPNAAGRNHDPSDRWLRNPPSSTLLTTSTNSPSPIVPRIPAGFVRDKRVLESAMARSWVRTGRPAAGGPAADHVKTHEAARISPSRRPATPSWICAALVRS